MKYKLAIGLVALFFTLAAFSEGFYDVVNRIGNLKEYNAKQADIKAKYNAKLKVQSEAMNTQFQKTTDAQNQAMQTTKEQQEKSKEAQEKAEQDKNSKKDENAQSNNLENQQETSSNEQSSNQSDKIVESRPSSTPTEAQVVNKSQNQNSQRQGSNWNIQYN